MSEHFIKNIEIKNFKLFKDFKASGFGRVNLIGGKNNVGKTAFMEACYLSREAQKSTRTYIQSMKIIKASIVIELNRDPIGFLLEEWLDYYDDFEVKYSDAEFKINNYKIDKKIFTPSDSMYEIILKRLYKRGHPPKIKNITFISMNTVLDAYLVDLIDTIKLDGKENEINNLLHQFFNIEKVDVIKSRVMLKTKKVYISLFEFGDGVKHFLNIILSLFVNKDSVLYLDEIENGIHYSNYDKLWEIILTISKKQNVQVFTTTHSKECIESYARVAKKLEDEDITFIDLGRNKNNEIKALVMDKERFFRELEMGNEVRGW